MGDEKKITGKEGEGKYWGNHFLKVFICFLREREHMHNMHEGKGGGKNLKQMSMEPHAGLDLMTMRP